MSLESAIAAYGYWAVFAGCVLEGEMVLLLAGFAAHQGYLQIELVMLVAFVGAFCGDQTFFWLGRWRGAALLEKRPRWRAQVERVQKRLGRGAIPLMIGFRFLYGVRIATPVAIGVSSIRARLFVPLSLVGSASWAAVIAAVGYFFGAAAQAMLGRVKKFEAPIFAAVVAVGLTIAVVRRLRERKM